MLALSLTVAALEAVQAHLPRGYEGWMARLVIMGLCYAQPLVRSWQRYRTRLFSYRPPVANFPIQENSCQRLPFTGRLTVNYWSEEACDRTALLDRVIAYLNKHRWGKTIDSGWENWDLEIYCHPWTVVQICTAQEVHGSRQRLIRVRFRLRPSGYTKLLGFAALSAGGVACLLQAWPAAVIAAGLFVAALGVWWRGGYRASQAVGLFDALARQMHLVPCHPLDKLAVRKSDSPTKENYENTKVGKDEN